MVTLHTAHTGAFFRKTFSLKLCGSAFLGCGGRPEGPGRGGPGQQQGAPPGQPIPASRAATRGGGGGGSGGGTGTQRAPSLRALRPPPPPALRLPPSSRAPIATFHPLPARAASFLPPLLPLPFPRTAQRAEAGFSRDSQTELAARAGEGFTWEDSPGKSQTERLQRDTGGEKRVICTDSQKKVDTDPDGYGGQL